MSLIDIAIQTLRTTKIAMNAHEIWEYIDENGLYETDGKTPWNSINSHLGRAIREGDINSVEIVDTYPRKFRYISKICHHDRLNKSNRYIIKLNNLDHHTTEIRRVRICPDCGVLITYKQ